jgi:hypothetical protein
MNLILTIALVALGGFVALQIWRWADHRRMNQTRTLLARSARGPIATFDLSLRHFRTGAVTLRITFQAPDWVKFFRASTAVYGRPKTSMRLSSAAVGQIGELIPVATAILCRPPAE